MKKVLLLISFLMITIAAWAVTGLNPYAYNLKAEQINDNRTLRISYCLNAPAKAVTIKIFRDDVLILSKKGKTTETSFDRSKSTFPDNHAPNIVDISMAELLKYDGIIGEALTWSIEVEGTSPSSPTLIDKTFSFYCPQGVAVDKNPQSPYFGRILVTESLDGVAIASGKNYTSKSPYSKNKDGKIVGGVYAFSPDFRKITQNEQPSKLEKGFPQVLKTFSTGYGNFDGGHQPYQIKISDDSRIFVSSGDKRSDEVVVWELTPDLANWKGIIKGDNTWSSNWVIQRNNKFYAGFNCSMDVKGSGENLKLLLYSSTKAGVKEYKRDEYRLDEYAIGSHIGSTFTSNPTNITSFNKKKYGLVYDKTCVIYDGEGGYWFGASRGAGVESEPNLVHVNRNGKQAYFSYTTSYHGGAGLLIHQPSKYPDEKWLIKGISRNTTTEGRFRIWKVTKDYSKNTTTIKSKFTVASPGLGRSHNAFAIDYAENLFVVGNDGEKLLAFALPYCGTKTTEGNTKIVLKEVINPVIFDIALSISNDSYVNEVPMGTVDGGGAHLELDNITVSAIPTDANRYEFEKWTEGDEVVSTDANYTFLVKKERNLVAHFKIKKFKVEYFNLFLNKEDITDKFKTYANPATQMMDYQRNTRLWRLFQVEYNAAFNKHKDGGEGYANGNLNSRELFRVRYFLHDTTNIDGNTDSNKTIRQNTEKFLDTDNNSPFYWLGQYLEHVVGKPIIQLSDFNIWADYLQSFINRAQHRYNLHLIKDGEKGAIIKGDYVVVDFSHNNDSCGLPQRWRKWWQQIELKLDTNITYDTQLPGTWHMRTPPTGSIYQRDHEFKIEKDSQGNNIKLTPGNWYKWNDHAANPGKVLGWYYGEKDPTTWITDPSQVEIVHNVTKSGNLVAIWLDNYIAQDKNNYDVVKLLKTNTGVDHSVRVFHPLQGGMYNTICLPFAVRALPNQLAGAKVLKLHNSEIVQEQAVSSIDEPVDEGEGDDEGEGEGDTFEGEQLLNIYFTEVTFEGDDIMEAGVPYLIMPTEDIAGEITFVTTSDDMYEMQKDGLGRIVTDANNNIAFQGVINPYKLQDNAHTLILVADNRLAVPTIHIDDSDEENIVISNNDILGLRGYFILQGEAAAQSLAYQSTMYLPEKTPTELPDNVETAPKNTTHKVMYNGRIYILRGDEVYDLMGNRVR